MTVWKPGPSRRLRPPGLQGAHKLHQVHDRAPHRAAGAIEAAFCALAIRDGIIPPTINLHNPDPDCDLDYVPGKARRKKIKTALSNSFGFGGHNATLILRRLEEGRA
jgi:hypothetical protein